MWQCQLLEAIAMCEQYRQQSELALKLWKAKPRAAAEVHANKSLLDKLASECEKVCEGEGTDT